MTWKAYPEYKDSGVDWLGDIPTEWRVERLRFNIRANPTKAEVRDLASDTSVSFVPMEAVGEYGGLRLDQTKLLEEVSNGYTYFRDGDVLVAKITPCFENGKGAIAAGLENGIGFGTTELHVVRPEHKIDQTYLFYLTIGYAFRHIGTAYMYGASGQKRVPEDFIRNLRHPIPPIDEQCAITAFLNRETERIDTLIAKKERQIELLQEKRAALISHLVSNGLNPDAEMKESGIEWLGKIPAHWEVKPLRHLILGGTRNGLYKGKEYYQDDGIPMIQMGEAFDSQVIEKCAHDRVRLMPSEHVLWQVQEGDLLFARRSLVFEGSGKCSIIGKLPKPHVFESSLIRARPDKSLVIPFFLYWFLQSQFSRSEILAMTKKVTISGVDSQQIKGATVAVPPLQEQEEILKFIEWKNLQIDGLMDRVMESVDRLKEYRSSLISAAVTGKIDVREGIRL